MQSNKELLNDKIDKDFRKMVEDDIEVLSEKCEQLSRELKILLLPKDPNDEKDVIIEIRAGTGGDEAALFAGDLLRMYIRYAERNRFKTELLSSNPVGVGGYKEVIISLAGTGAYSKLKYESGVHRVQRVPLTESQGRIHTSAATVAVLPEAEDVEVNINQNDLRVDVFRSGGHGGQSVNTTDSAVRITHIPTGVVVTCQDEKSQLKNKEKAMKVLKARIYEAELKKYNDEMAQNRKNQVGSGDRSERIRTYNFPQGRVTDHRIGLTVYKLEAFLDGEIDEMIDALHLADQSEQLKNNE
jgi:peptide chain release factor 1